jgi:hypothetical protein
MTNLVVDRTSLKTKIKNIMKHIKYMFIILAVVALAACQLLKKDKLTLKKLSQKEELQVTEQRNIVSAQSQLLLIDSSQHDYTMMLWPKGNFKFTVANGFEGEAEKVVLIGKHTKQQILRAASESKRDSTLVKASYSKQQERITTVNKRKTSLGYNWGWLLLLPLVYIGYKLYRGIS